MSSSYTLSASETFTLVHARHMGAKVATDLKRMQRFYGSPSDARITEFETEVVALLRAGYLDTVTYGFQRDGNWIEPALRYTARDLIGSSATDDDPGRIRPGADVSGASFRSYLSYGASWLILTAAERQAFEATLPIARSGAPAPGVDGYLGSDLTYWSGGRALDRATVRSYR